MGGLVVAAIELRQWIKRQWQTVATLLQKNIYWNIIFYNIPKSGAY